MLLKILSSISFDLKEAEYFIKYYILRGRQKLSDACECSINGDRCMFCFIGSLKGPHSHQYYLNKNNAFLDASDHKQIEKVLEDQAAVARQNE